MSSPGGVRGQARGQMEARVLELSLGGARLELPATLEVGSVHDFVLVLGTETVSVRAAVRRCGPTVGDSYEAAVEFVSLPPAEAERIGRYLEGER
jgi:PilZ domain-containing protein